MTPGEWLISPEAQVWRRRLDPFAWMVLEEVALSAKADGVAAIAAVSCRVVADAVRLDRDAVARAIRRLCQVGLLARVEQARVGGRFAPAGYRVLVPCRPKADPASARQVDVAAPRRSGSGEQLMLIPTDDVITSPTDRNDPEPTNHHANHEPDRRDQHEVRNERASAGPWQTAHEFASAMRPGVATVLVTDRKPSMC